MLLDYEDIFTLAVCTGKLLQTMRLYQFNIKIVRFVIHPFIQSRAHDLRGLCCGQSLQHVLWLTGTLNQD